MNVAELIAEFGVEVDAASIAKAEAAIKKLKADTERAANTSKLSAALKHAYGDSAKGVQMMGFRTQSFDAAQKDLDEKRAARNKQLAGMLAKGALVATGLTAAGLKGMMSMVHATAEAGAAADDLSQKLGISQEAVQELGFAATMSGSSQDGLADALGHLGKNADLAKKGSKDAAKAFKAAGIDVKELTGGHEQLDGYLELVADKFKAMPDGVAKSNLALELFGKSGRELIPLLNEGSDGIQALRAQAEDMGIVIDNKTSSALENFGDETDKVKMQLAGLRNDAIKAILPDLLELVRGMQAWIKSHRAELVAALTAAMKGLIAVVKVAGVVFKVLVDGLAWMNEHGNAASAIILALAAAFGVLAVGAESAWLAILGPIGAVIAVIAVLSAKWEDIVAGMLHGIDAVVKAVKWVGRQFAALWSGAKSAASSAWSVIESVGHGIKSVFDATIGKIARALEWLKDKATGIFDWVADKAKGILDRISDSWVGDAAGWVKDKAVEYGGGLINKGIDAIIGSNDAPTSSLPSRSMSTIGPGVGGGVNINGNTTTIQVNAPNADPTAVADIVEQRQSQFWDRQMRSAIAGAGVA